MITRPVSFPGFSLGGGAPLVLIAGPCVLESEKLALEIAEFLKNLTARLQLPWIFKASFDKANRSSLDSFRGPGWEKGLALLGRIRREFQVPVTSDIHTVDQAGPAGEVLDLIQIPAFLCRQTDLLLAAGKTGRAVNLKKGQFMAPEDMLQAAAKVESTGNRQILITERGSFFGYHNLVVDFRSLPILRRAGYPAVFDATHSVQRPASQGVCSGGERHFIPFLARAAAAAGIDALFLEVHPAPEQALCDGPNSWPLAELEELLLQIMELDALAQKAFRPGERRAGEMRGGEGR